MRTEAVLFDLLGTVVPYPIELRLQVEDVLAEGVGVPSELLRDAWRGTFPERARGGDPVQLLRNACGSIGAAISTEQAEAALAARRDLFGRSFRAREGA